MSLNVKTGTIVQPGSTGNQTYTLDSGFDPKALIIMCVGRADGDTGGSANSTLCIGYATDRGGTAAQHYAANCSADNVGTSVVHPISGTSKIVALTNGANTTLDLEVSFVEFQSNGFVLNWTNLSAITDVRLSYVVIGGSDVLDAHAGSISSPASPGGVSTTITAGFGQPDLLFFLQSWHGTDAPAANNNDMWWGYGTKEYTGGGRGARWGSATAAATQATNQGTFNNRAHHSGAIGGGTWVFSLDAPGGWPVDGFSTTWASASGAGFPAYYMALRFSSSVVVDSGEVDMSTDAFTQTFLASADKPRLALAMHCRTVASNSVDSTSGDASVLGMGAVDGDGNQWWMAASDDDGQAVASVCGTYQTALAMIGNADPSGSFADGEGVATVAADEFIIDWSTPTSNAFLMEWLTLAAPDPTSPVITPDYRSFPKRHLARAA